MSAHQALRAATASDHETVDAAFGRFDLATADGYRAFLTAHASVLPAVEAVLAGASIPALRERTSLVRADLAAFGARMPTPLRVAPPSSQAAAFGMAYVIEGSRLGGGMLARRIGDVLPKTYLADVHRSGEWRSFTRALDEAADRAADRAGWIDQATAAARAVFALYAAAASREGTASAA